MAKSNAERQREYVARLKAQPVKTVEVEVVKTVEVPAPSDLTGLSALVDRLYADRKINMLGRRELLDWIARQA